MEEECDNGNYDLKFQSSPGEIELVLPWQDFSLGYFAQFVVFLKVIGNNMSWFSTVET